MDITNEVLKKAKEMGGDLAGIAPVERFKNAPLRMSPLGLLPSAKSVIVVAIHHPDAAVELGGEPTPHDTGPYNVQGYMNCKLDDISFLIGRFLEDRGYTTLPIVSTNIWRYNAYKDLKVDFAPDMAHRYAAVAAGLGEIGWSGLFLSPEFGPRQRAISIITEAELTPTPMYNGPALCDKCMECAKNCPTDAFYKEVKRINKIEIGGKIFEFPEINKWRCAWAENFGLSLDIKIPEKVDEKVILRYQEKYGWRGGEEGSCLKFCMVPEKRYYDLNYSRAPRRKKEPSVSEKDAWQKIEEICREKGVDVYSVSDVNFFEDEGVTNPKLHLPDAVSVISLGVNVSLEDRENNDAFRAIYRSLGYAAFEITHYLDVKGYSAIMDTKIFDNLMAQKTGIYREDMLFKTVLTSAKLTPGIFPKIPNKRRGVVDAEEVKRFCHSAGADVVGVFNNERYEDFRRKFQELIHLPTERKAVRDSGVIYGEYIPEIYTETIDFKSLETWLKNARSVIVLGLHYTHTSLDTAKITPAETVNPYVFAQYETILLLKDMALKIVRNLNSYGRRATFTTDLTGLGSRMMMTSRGWGEGTDGRADLFPALLAGLAYPGLHGYPITKEYGTRQRFIAIVTDCPFDNDPLYSGGYACARCDKPCISACPTSALKNKTVELKIEGKDFHIPLIDQFSCDWAKRYGLSGKAGPQYYGKGRDVPVPKDKKPEEIVKAINSVRWGVQKRHLNICEECLRVCPEKGQKS
jgi:epoxyqueuosine reductase QueG